MTSAANRRVIESAVPAADGKKRFTDAQPLRKKVELDDITAWLEDQEEAEMQFLVNEIANKHHREARRAYF